MNFRTFLFSSVCGLALAAGHAQAAQNDAVTEFDSVDSFRTWATGATNTQLQNLTSFHLAAYYCATPSDRTGAPCPADGGEGLFVQKNNAAGNSCANNDDGGRTLRITKGLNTYCYRRQNLNGDARQFGATKGSVYDCSPTTGTGLSGCTDAKDVLANLIAAATAENLHRLTTSGVQIKTSLDVDVPSGMELDLGGIQPQGHRANDSLLDIPGSLFIHTGKSVNLSDHSGIRNGIILPDWYTAPANIHDLYEIRHNMIINGDTGLTCNASGCLVDGMEIDGFDTAFEADHATYLHVNNTLADGNVCYFMHGGGAGTKFSSTACFPSASAAPVDNQEYFGVTGISESPLTPGTCRVTLAQRLPIHGDTPPDVDDIENDMMIWGGGAGKATGGVNIDNRFHATVISATATTGTVDLVGSKCDDDGAGYLNGSTVTATWKKGDKRLIITSGTTDQILGNEVIRGMSGSGIPQDTAVDGVWAKKNTVILDTAPTADGSGSVTFKSQAFSGRSVDCNATNTGICVVLDASVRIDAGDSEGGKNAGDGSSGSGVGRATGYLIGGPDDGSVMGVPTDEVAGFTSADSHVFGHAIQYHVENSNETSMFAPASDRNGDYDDPNTYYTIFDGNSNNASFVGGHGPKAGTAILVDATGDPNQCFSFSSGSAQAESHTYTQFEVDHGCFIAEGVRPGGGNIFVANDVGHVDLNGSYLPGSDIYFEGDEAQGKTTSLTSMLGSGANNLINLNFDAANSVMSPAPLPPLDTALQVVQADGLKARIVEDAFGETAVVSGRRAEGTLASPTRVTNGDELAEFGGMGYDGANYSAQNAAGIGVEACENWTSTTTCAALTFKATEDDHNTVAEVGRIESAGLGINSGAGVGSQLEVVSTAVSTTLSGALNNSSMGAITVASTAGFPSPGTMLIDGEAIGYKVASSTSLNITSRGAWGTAAAAHSSGAVVSYFSEFKGNPSTPRLDFATDSLGDMWWRGHLLSGGSLPTLSGTGLGTSPNVVGNDSAGRITVGTSPSGTTFTVTFAQPWQNAPICFAQDETNTAKNPIVATGFTTSGASTTAVTFTANAAPAASNKISYSCVGFR